MNAKGSTYADVDSPRYEQESLSPSHPSFDRSKYSDAEYIDLLKLEIRDLQEQIYHHGRVPRHFPQTGLSNETCPDNLPRNIHAGQLPIEESEVPQRSARRNDDNPCRIMSLSSRLTLTTKAESTPIMENNRTSVASITSNGPIDVSDGMILSPDLRTELNALASSAVPSEETSSEDMENKSLFSNFEKGSQGITDNDSHENGRNRAMTGETSSSSFICKGSAYDATSGDQHFGSNSSPITSVFKPRIRLPVSRGSSETPKTDIDHQGAGDWRDSARHSSPQISSKGTQDPSNDNVLGKKYLRGAHSDISSLRSELRQTTPRCEAKRASTSNESALDSPQIAPTLSACEPDDRRVENLSPEEVDSLESDAKSRELSEQATGSSFSVLSLKVDEDDASLFIKPKDFPTVRIKVVSTITVNSKRTDDYNCTFSINDKETDKEMWRFRKSYNQIVSFDSEIRPFIEFFGLPPLPEKSVFSSATPIKVDLRSRALQKYFDTIFVMPHIPQMVLLRICKYISVDFVNPLDDYRSGAKKEGFLIRRYKGLGTSWKVRWCQVDGPLLEIYDLPGGSMIEQIKLSGSQIGRQSSDVIAEERGYRHAFLVLESSKSSKLSGLSPKHFFCAESDLERDEWIGAMVEFTENDPLANEEKIVSEQPHFASTGKELKHALEDTETAWLGQERQSLAGQIYSTAQVTDDDTESQTVVDDTSHKSNKKTKKRHLFPFRSKYGQVEDMSSMPTSSAVVSSDSQGTDQTMQNYLNRLDLSSEQSKAVFGRDLKYVQTLSSCDFEGVKIPSICFRCLDFLKRTGAVYEEGIFRLSGSASTIRLLKDDFNRNFDVDLFESQLKPDINTVAGLLKTYLRELPHSIFGDATYHELQRIVTENSEKHSQSEVSIMVKEALQNLSKSEDVNYTFSSVVLGFLRSVVANSSVNKMSLKNVCIVFVPTLNISVEVLSLCLVDYDHIFGDSAPVADHEREILDLQIPLF